jgi:hypothetical protein
MKASELRIGNWVYERRCDGKLYEGQVTEIRQFDTVDKIKCNGWYADSPIPLTEEWLLKFGFVDGSYLYKNYKVKAGDYWNSVKFYEGEWCYNNDDSDAGCYFLTTIKYVHQLQNLYFALTNEEL